MMDNDPKHMSHHVPDYIEVNNINWWKMPSELLEVNPIENLWHELKEFIRREIKPRMKSELVDGILAFLETVDPPKFIKYINHLKKGHPKSH